MSSSLGGNNAIIVKQDNEKVSTIKLQGIAHVSKDLKCFGATDDNYMLWDADEDTLKVNSSDDGVCLKLTSSDTGSSQGPTQIFSRLPGEAGADNDNLGAILFKGKNDNATPETITFGQITSKLIDASDSTEAGRIDLRVQCGGAGTNLVTALGSSTAGVGTVTIGGGLVVGANSATQGTISLWDGAGGNTPGYMILYSPNGTANYIFCEDDGTLKRHTSAPTANADGSEIGGQS